MGSNSIINGVIWKFTQSITSQGVTFILSIILARLLLPEEYGIIAIINVFIIFANVFITDGFTASLIQKKDADNIDVNTMLYCSLAISIILYLILFLFSSKIAVFFNEPQLKPVIKIYSLCLILNSYNAIQIAWLSKKLLFKKQFTSTFFASVLSGCIGIFLAYHGAGIWAIVTQNLCSTFFNILILSKILEWHPSLTFSFYRARSLMSYGSKILSSNLLRTISIEIRQLLIGKYFNVADLAIYNRGQSFPSFFYTNITSTISSVLFPAMSNYAGDVLAIKNLMRKTIQVNSLCLCFFIGLLALTAKPLIIILLTEKWIACTPFLQLSCLSTIIGIISTINIQALKAIGKSNTILKLEIIKMPAFLILLILSINISLMAVAITLPIYSLYSAIVNTSPSKKYFNYSYFEQLKDFLPAFCIASICWIFSLASTFFITNIWILFLSQIISFSISYAGLCFFFKPDGISIILEKIYQLRK